MAYSFDQIFAADPSNPSNVAQNASITIFAPGDGTMTPLTITDPDGQPLSNPIPVNANGFGSAFAHATLDRVAWAGGGFTGFFTSYEGMKGEAVAARAAAESAAATAGAEAAAAVAAVTADVDAAAAAATDSAASAEAAATAAALSASLVEAPADTTIGTLVSTTDSATRTAIAAAIATETTPKLDKTEAASTYLTQANAATNYASTAKLASRSRLGNKWAFLGDSIMVGGWSGLLHTDTWPTYASLYSKGKIQIVANAGVSGNTTAQMLARIQADVIAKAPQVCAVSGGTNDISQGVTLATFKANIGAIVAALRAANIAPVLATITPNAVSTARTASTALWNQWIRRYAAQEQIPLIDFYAMMADPTNGQFKSGFNSGDNIHPGAEGYRAMGEYASTVMDPHLQPAALPLAVDGGDTYNLLQSPTFMTDAGGGLSTGWVGIRAGTGTRTFSRVDDAAIVGKWQQTVATAWTADVGVGNYQNTDLANKFVAGDRVAVSGLLSVPSLDPASTIVVEFKANPTTSWLVVNGLTRPLPGIVAFYGEYTMPAGFTGYELDAYLKNPTGGTNTGTIKIAQVSVYNLTKHGL